MSTIAFVSRRSARLPAHAAPFGLRWLLAIATRRRRRREWRDLVATSAHLQHDLGLVDTLPRTRAP